PSSCCLSFQLHLKLYCFLLHCPAADPHLHSFPTRRSSDLPRLNGVVICSRLQASSLVATSSPRRSTSEKGTAQSLTTWLSRSSSDRKSTRLNSSHVSISYAVVCLKKKIRPMCTATITSATT